MRATTVSPVVPVTVFDRLACIVQRLIEIGFPQQAIDVLLQEKILADLQREKTKIRMPSLN